MKFFTAALSLVVASSLFGAKVTAVKTNIAEEGFQMYIVVEALRALGHDVEITEGVEYPIAYKTVAQEEKNVAFMAASWDPLQNNMRKAVGDENLFIGGKYIENCAQGYLVDKKTAEQYNIKYINDLKDPKIAKLFDSNGNGKADLAGCAPGWGCEAVIEHQLDAFGLRDTITHNQGQYSAIVTDAIARYKTGKPILYYTWTPYWVSGRLVPGQDVVFLQVKESAHPVLEDTALPNGANYGFAVNAQRIVGNKKVNEHKDIAKLFSIMKLSVNDVSGENMLMTNGENKERDVMRHAKMWVESNKATFDKWIAEAKAAK
ncbi:glycine betaine/L-proline ABC transporter substrate-binding protein ProX [Sulfurospirillum sp. T05]|uniref:Glycine betaine/L-proline ABC transporter substrate-binding protein ProX n=1 Tax=Sulfurospirillum tamanense TaxID=2813362 RepID=A0ABS2WVV1_9BACT|nr:glycine betaine/L-proline ABC transporter substrate-binding protein ProX [Sulfurospirillum tamanensis]MBN2965349.1 glycine betaine/L-proline ABC transporter substrate-binding protein ProX [Sulfurospirillum tamanensis]